MKDTQDGTAPPERRPLDLIRPGDGDPRHGSTNGYVNLMCRCSDCRAAWAEYTHELRRRRPPLPEGDSRHGQAATYTNWNCRCTLCRGAHNQYNQDKRARRREALGAA